MSKYKGYIISDLHIGIKNTKKLYEEYKKMAKALLTSGQHRTKKYLYTLGYNIYGQEIVQRTQIDSEGHRIGNTYSAGFFNAYDYPEEWREKNV